MSIGRLSSVSNFVGLTRQIKSRAEPESSQTKAQAWVVLSDDGTTQSAENDTFHHSQALETRPPISAEQSVTNWIRNNMNDESDKDDLPAQQSPPQPTPENPSGYHLHGLADRQGWTKPGKGWQNEGVDEGVPGHVKYESAPATQVQLPSPRAVPVCESVERSAVCVEGIVEAWFRSRLEGKNCGDSNSDLIQAEQNTVPFLANDNKDDDETFLRRDPDCSADVEDICVDRTFPRRWSKNSLFPRIFGSGRTSMKPMNSMLCETWTVHDDLWFGLHLLRLQRDGMTCSKVARNGDIVQRMVYLAASASSTAVEVRGGRAGPKSVRLEDITDIRSGLSSADLRHFIRKFKKEQPNNLEERSFVLLSPTQKLNLIMPTVALRDTLAHCILYLLDPDPGPEGEISNGDQNI